MSLEAILAAIAAAGDSQVAEIEQAAQRAAAGVLASARADAEKARLAAGDRAAAPAYREHARILHRARLTYLRSVGDAREAAVDSVLERARNRLALVRADAGYPAILRRLAEEALDALRSSLEDPGHAHLEIDPRDEPLMAQMLHDLDLEIPVELGLDCWGGLVAHSEDGRIVVINTLESRLQRAMPFLRRYLAALFEQGEAPRLASIMETPAYER